MADPVQHLIQLTKSFNSFVQQVQHDFSALRGTLAQIVAGHNQLDKALEQLAARQAALEQGLRQVAGIISSGGSGAIPQVTMPSVQTVNGQVATVAQPAVQAAPAAPAVSASGAPMSEMSEEDAQILYSGGE